MTVTDEGVNTPMIFTFGLVSTVGLLAIIIFLVVVFFRVESRQQYLKDTSQPQVEVGQLAAQQRGALLDYRLLDDEKGVYGIPIDRAMKITVARRRENPEGPPGTPDKPPAKPEPKAESKPKPEGESP